MTKYIPEWNLNASAYNAEEVVTHVVDGAVDYYDGQLEALQRKVDKLVSIIADLAAVLPEAQRDELMGKLGYKRSEG